MNSKKLCKLVRIFTDKIKANPTSGIKSKQLNSGSVLA